jgi:hypothetical protein
MDNHHEELLHGFYEQMKSVMDLSEQAMYIYLDDTHKICNAKFASLLGYLSPNDWAKVERSFPESFVVEKSRTTLVKTYQTAMEKKTAACVSITWAKKSGGSVESTVILVPVPYADHLVAVHFIS